MVNVYCFTNIDDFRREKWPTTMAGIPSIGQGVQSQAGRVLKIVAITHCIDDLRMPFLRVELHR